MAKANIKTVQTEIKAHGPIQWGSNDYIKDVFAVKGGWGYQTSRGGATTYLMSKPALKQRLTERAVARAESHKPGGAAAKAATAFLDR